MTHDQHQQFYNELAAEWDLQFTAEDLERLSNLIERLDIQPGSDILDLGCGTGVLFDILRRRIGEKGTVTGVDFSIEMVRQAHRNFPFENINVVDADVSNLPFKDDMFDFAVSFSAFDNFADKLGTLREVHRVLKPNARLCIIHLVSSKELSEQHHKEGGVLAEDELPSAERMAELFTDSKFRTVRIEDHPGLYIACAINEK